MFTLLPDTVADRVPVAMAAWISETLISELLSLLLELSVLVWLSVFDTVTDLSWLSDVVVLVVSFLVTVLLLLSVVLVLLLELSLFETVAALVLMSVVLVVVVGVCGGLGVGVFVGFVFVFCCGGFGVGVGGFALRDRHRLVVAVGGV